MFKANASIHCWKELNFASNAGTSQKINQTWKIRLTILHMDDVRIKFKFKTNNLSFTFHVTEKDKHTTQSWSIDQTTVIPNKYTHNTNHEF